MDTVNKDKAVLEWAMANPYLTDALLYEWLGEHGGSCALSQIPGEAAVVPMIDGSAVKQYDFMFQVMFPLSEGTDDTNTDNMFTQRQWQDWIDEMEQAGDYPDFGPRCYGYELQNLASDPQLAQVFENGMAKYQFPARLIYMEVK